jgi:hypothetical protein
MSHKFAAALKSILFPVEKRSSWADVMTFDQLRTFEADCDRTRVVVGSRCAGDRIIMGSNEKEWAICRRFAAESLLPP